MSENEPYTFDLFSGSELLNQWQFFEPNVITQLQLTRAKALNAVLLTEHVWCHSVTCLSF